MSSNSEPKSKGFKSKLRKTGKRAMKALHFLKKQKKSEEAKKWDQEPDVQQRIAPFFSAILDRNTQNLVDDFNLIEDPIVLKKMKAFEENASKGRNRFNHIGVWDETRVELTLGPQSYIHANYIATPKHPQRIIATQAPIDKTSADFWYMVLQEETDIIIGLCQLDEKKDDEDDEPVPVKRTPSFLDTIVSTATKIRDSLASDPYEGGEGTICYPYFPLEKHDVVEFNDGELKVECTDVKEHEYLRTQSSTDKTIVIERTLSITFKDRWLVCRHYHWIHNKHEAWKSNCVPMKFLESLPKTDKPIVMQCRTGVLLTGAFVMFQYYLDLLETDCEVLPPLAYLREMKDQRHNFLGKWKFVYFVHMVMLRYFWEKINMEHANYRDFDKAYGDRMQKFDLDSLG